MGVARKGLVKGERQESLWRTKQLRKKLLLRAWLAYLKVVALSCERAVSRTSCATVLRLSSTSGVRVFSHMSCRAGRGAYRGILR